MRELYNIAKEDLKCIMGCEEMKYYNELCVDEEYQLLKNIYDRLICVFIKREEKDKFVLTRCKFLDEILEKFLSKGLICLRRGGSVKRVSEYKVTYKKNDASISNAIILGHLSDGHSVAIKNLFQEPEWIRDI